MRLKKVPRKRQRIDFEGVVYGDKKEGTAGV